MAAQWYVQLIGNRHNLEDLCRWFPDGPIRVVQDGETFSLTGERFSETEDHKTIKAIAEAAIDNMTAAARLLIAPFERPSIGSAHQIDEHGHRHAVVFGARFDLVIRARLQGKFDPDERPTEAQKLVVAAATTPSLSTAMLLWADDARTWPRLYRILEEVENSLKTSVSKAGLCSENERERFKRCANVPEAAGLDSRHASGKHDPPRKPMDVREATEFVRRALFFALQKALNVEARDEG